MTPKLNRVIRLDSLPLNQTFFTPEGYLIDRPVVTSCGIFEYHNNDGSVRRELRLPEEVFSPKSLASFKGKPVIVTHDAGLVDKSNVGKFQIGTILSDGYRSGDDVRAEIVINDTDEMKRCGFKELSLGYNLDLDETPGEWHGQRYDAIQRNITINHLAIVKEARAGDQARLNIDSRDKQVPKGVKLMANVKKTSRADGTLSPEEFSKAIEEYKARRAKMASAKDAEDAPVQLQKPSKEAPAVEAAEDVPVAAEAKEEPNVPVKLEQDAEEPEVVEEEETVVAEPQKNVNEEQDQTKTIAQMDEDMSILFDIIDTLLAEREFKKEQPQEQPQGQPQMPQAQGDSAKNSKMPFDKMETLKDSEDDQELEELQEDDDENEEAPVPAYAAAPAEKLAKDADEDDLMVPAKEPTKMNVDSVDAIVRQRIQIGIMGDRLNLDGLENMPIKKAKETIIRAVRPTVRLDGKSATYVNAMFDLACAEISKNRGTAYQKTQMFNKKNRMDSVESKDSASIARQRMINRFNKKED